MLRFASHAKAYAEAGYSLWHANQAAATIFCMELNPPQSVSLGSITRNADDLTFRSNRISPAYGSRHAEYGSTDRGSHRSHHELW